MPTPREIKLVIFDWAGTTVDFGCQAPTSAFVDAFAQRGVPISVREVRKPMGLHKKDHLRTMLQEPDLSERWRKQYGRDWAEYDVNDLYELVTPMQVAAARRCGHVIPGVVECVDQLRDMGIRIAGTTGYFQAAADVCYEVAASEGYVPDAMICADEVPAGRPAPWMIFKMMERLNVYPPRTVVKVGDTIVDIEDGLNAGVWSVGVIDSSNEMGLTREEFTSLGDKNKDRLRDEVRERFEMAGAHASIHHLGQLLKLIEAINKSLAYNVGALRI